MPLNKNQQKQFDMVCERMARGESLVDICSDKNTPGYSTVTAWLRDDESGDLQAMYARAREDQAEYQAGEIVKIADDQDLDPNSRRVMVDARKWIASKLKPRVYGDKIDHKVSGSLTIGIRRNERVDGD
jgi:hypothetical protein